MASDAIIFVPGIKGTKLVDTNRVSHDTIWSGLQSNFETIEDLELSHTVNQQHYDEKIDTIVHPGEIEELAYAEFLRDLDTDKPIYIYNYDWRFSAAENGTFLEDFITYLMDKSKASPQHKNKPFKKFDLITHSLGNFVVRNYLKYNGFQHVNKIIFTVPPFGGALDIAQVALIGEGWFPNVKAKIRKLIRTFPGALELLPSYADASRFNTGSTKHDFFTFDHWQENVTNPTSKRGKDIARKLKAALNVASATVQTELQDLSQLSPAQRERILIITRTGYDTWQSIKVYKTKAGEPKNFFDFAHACKTKNGDGRVPDVSSCCYHKDVLTLTIEDAIFYKDYSHGFVLKDERVQKITNRFLKSSFAKFDYNIPGRTVKKVKGLTEKEHKDTKLPYWEVSTA